MASADEKVVLTPERAIALLADGEYVHNYMQGGMALIGCDYSRQEAIDALSGADLIELAGPTARAIKHPIATWKDNRVSFFEADMERLEAFEAEQVPAQ